MDFVIPLPWFLFFLICDVWLVQDIICPFPWAADGFWSIWMWQLRVFPKIFSAVFPSSRKRTVSLPICYLVHYIYSQLFSLSVLNVSYVVPSKTPMPIHDFFAENPTILMEVQITNIVTLQKMRMIQNCLKSNHNLVLIMEKIIGVYYSMLGIMNEWTREWFWTESGVPEKFGPTRGCSPKYIVKITTVHRVF